MSDKETARSAHWDALLQAAILGASRSSLPGKARAALEAYGVDMEGDFVQQLLSGAAVLDALRRTAAPLATYTGPVPEPEAADSSLRCPPEAVKCLLAILRERHEGALPEFLALLCQQGHPLPYMALPALFDRAQRTPALWATLGPAMGSRGQWLLAQNSQWGGTPPAVNEAQWHTGTAAERCAYLRAERRRDTGAGLGLLAHVWPQEPYEDRLALLAVLEEGLSLADEAFLESCLDERRKELRQAAARLLAMLPASALSGRLWGYAEACMTFDGKSGWAFRAPAELLEAQQRDALASWKKGAAQTLGQQWLLSILAYIPPARWAERTGMDAAALLPLLRAEADVGQALAMAALRFDDEAWVEALLRWYAHKREEAMWKTTLGGELLRRAPAGAVAQLVSQQLAECREILGPDSMGYHLLCQTPHPWPDELARAVIGGFQQHLAGPYSLRLFNMHYQSLLRVAAYKVSPALGGQLQGQWPYQQSSVWLRWAGAVEAFDEALDFREGMRRALIGQDA